MAKHILLIVFYLLITTSGISSLAMILAVLENFTSSFFYKSPYYWQDLNFSLSLGLPSIFICALSLYIINKVKNPKVFFICTFFITVIGHYFLSRQTSILLGDFRLVLAASVYVAFLSWVLTIAREKIFLKQHKNVSMFLMLIVGMYAFLVLFLESFLFDAYLLFASSLNKIDYLFSKLQLDFSYFVIITLNLLCCFTFLLYIISQNIYFSRKHTK